jgi:hypothetical protein
MAKLSLQATRDALLSDGLSRLEADCIVYYGAHYCVGFLTSIAERLQNSTWEEIPEEDPLRWAAEQLRALCSELVIEAAKLAPRPADGPELPAEIK